MHDEPQFQTLSRIFEAALVRIDPYGMLKERMRLVGSRLVIEFEAARHEVELSGFSRILVLGCGKASARMAKAVEEIFGAGLPSDIEWGGLVCTKYGHTERFRASSRPRPRTRCPTRPGWRRPCALRPLRAGPTRRRWC